MSEQVQEPQNDKALRLARAEYGRVKVKRRETTDKDVQSALDLRLKQLEEEFGDELKSGPKVVNTPKLTFPEDLTLPAAEIAREADMLVARSFHSRTKGDKTMADRLLKEAFTKAPNAPSVLEALGDDYLERRMYEHAREVFERAKLLDPKSANIERKYGLAVLTQYNAGSIDDQLRLGLNDSMLLNANDQVAGGASALILSVFLPGLGHLILGRTVTGISILVGWLVSLIWFLLDYKDFAALIQLAAGKQSQPSLGVLIPLFIMAIIWIGTLKSLTGPIKSETRQKVDRPRPPVDLPFE